MKMKGRTLSRAFPRTLQVGLVLVGLVLLACAVGCSDKKKAEGDEGVDKDAEISKAVEGLKMIMDGAITFFQEEHVVGDTGMQIETSVFPAAVEPVCTAGPKPKAGKVTKDETDWEPWEPLRFVLAKDQVFRFCFRTTPDRKKLFAWAEAALDGEKADTFLCTTVETAPEGYPVAAAVAIGDAPCTFE